MYPQYVDIEASGLEDSITFYFQSAMIDGLFEILIALTGVLSIISMAGLDQHTRSKVLLGSILVIEGVFLTALGFDGYHILGISVLWIAVAVVASGCLYIEIAIVRPLCKLSDYFNSQKHP